VKFIEALQNTETGEVRYVYDLGYDNHVVVKFFDPIQKEQTTFKWFRGSYQAVRSHWRTQTPITVTGEQLHDAENVIKTGLYSLLLAFAPPIG